MRILLAPDSFKESASAEAIAQAMVRGIKRGNPQAECRLMPLSDGGEGLTQAWFMPPAARCTMLRQLMRSAARLPLSLAFLAIIMLLVFSTPPWSNWLRQADLNGSPLPTAMRWLLPRSVPAC